jgi:4-diphosphocytidyl-2-C-methyl-D-erythritol kinase
MKIKSFSKINLGIEVVKKRKDNYHEIRTLFQTINFFDIIDFRPNSADQIFLRGDDKRIPWDEDNLVHQAALLLKSQFRVSKGVEIVIHKNIPPGKGLGGGSSNAAMTLFALNKIWELSLGKEALINLGKKIGADVPFFLEGGLCLGLEKGDKIIPQKDLAPFPCVLALPSISISTANIYSQFQFSLTSKNKDSKIIKFLNSRDFGLLENRLEETVFSLYPQLKVLKSLLSSLGSEVSLLTGTGSAVFGLFSEKGRAEKGLERLKKITPSLLVETLPREHYWESVDAGV